MRSEGKWKEARERRERREEEYTRTIYQVKFSTNCTALLSSNHVRALYNNLPFPTPGVCLSPPIKPTLSLLPECFLSGGVQAASKDVKYRLDRPLALVCCDQIEGKPSLHEKGAVINLKKGDLQILYVLNTDVRCVL